MLLRSLAQPPKSISLQRLLQKGRKLLSSVHSTDFLQFGQSTLVVFVFIFRPPFLNIYCEVPQLFL